MENLERFEPITIERVPLDKQGLTMINLFVYLPTSNRFVRFIAKGSPVDQERVSLLDNAAHRDLFHLPSELIAARKLILDSQERGEWVEKKSMHDFGEFKVSGDAHVGEKFSITVNTAQNTDPRALDGGAGAKISSQSQDAIKRLYKELVSNQDLDPAKMLAALEDQVDQIMNAIAPDVKELKTHLVKNLKFLMLMNDVSAITSIAVLAALAQGYDSKKSFRDLSLACLIMDASLVEFSEAQIEAYYKNPEAMPPDELAKMKKHPAKSFEIAESKLKSVPDVSMQLILNHHELFNGRGFPRGVRSEALFPMVKVLSLAVNIFEEMKKATLLDIKDTSLNKIIIDMLEEHNEPHLRRHSRKVVTQLIKYLDIDIKNPSINKLQVINFGPDDDTQS